MNGTFHPEEATNGGAPQSEPTNGESATTTAPGLSADEIALYDRQIRLWGAQAQERIRSANILLVSLRALGTEIAKNLTLAGISSLTIIDNEAVTEEDLGTQYFLREEDVGKSVSSLPLIRSLPTMFLTFSLACGSSHSSYPRTQPSRHCQSWWSSHGSSQPSRPFVLRSIRLRNRL